MAKGTDWSTPLGCMVRLPLELVLLVVFLVQKPYRHTLR